MKYSMELLAPCSVGEIFDKISILEIKEKKIKDPQKLLNVKRELSLLRGTVSHIELSNKLIDNLQELRIVNEELWIIEDDLRKLEKIQDYGDKFVQLARSVYITNDKRSLLKKRINILLGSKIIEEKSYDYL